MTYRAIIGHRTIKSMLSAAVARGSMPPSVLVIGPVGVGKHALAIATAAALNCPTPRLAADDLPLDACGTCRSCDRVARGMHVDVLVVEPDDRASIKTDHIREVLERTGYRPFEGRRRVVIVRDADAMETQAQNALLKSLEEPPPGTVFILLSAVPGVLLPTVRSRCMPLRVGRLTATEVAAILERDHALPASDARSLAALADGSVGAALDLGSSDVIALRDLALHLLTRAAAAPLSARLQAGAPVVTEGKKDRERGEVKLTLRALASMLRDVELINADADRRLLANPGLVDRLQRVAGAYDGDRARLSYAAVDRGLVALERNAGIKVVVDWLLSRM